ncbi:MAG: hypothetical protein P4L46_05750 [Fimbriimonas sp.]|nr:hypothetical protein [Fimbriimonas sp.]
MKTLSDVPMPRVFRRFWPVLFLAIVSAIPLYRALLMGEAIGPFEQIRQMAPWNGPKPAQPWDILQADGVLQFYVWRDLVFGAWGDGHIPFWNAYQLAGTPLLANSQSGALYPLHMLMGLLHVPTATAMTLLAWFHLFWAGLGIYFLSTRLGSGRVGGCVAGASFALSTFMVAWTGLPSVIETLSWLPWLLAFIAGVCGVGKGSTTQNWLLAAASASMMILAGHLQFVAYGMMAAVLFAAWLALSAGRSRTAETPLKPKAAVGRLALCFAALGIGAIMAGPQLLPVLKYSQFSHRRNSPSDAGYQAYIGSAVQPYELAKVLLPTIQGNPRELASETLPVSTYYPALLKPGANYAESALGLGFFVVLLLSFLLVSLDAWEPAVGLLGIGGLGLLLALGTPLNQLLYYGVPGWSSTGSPGRAECLFVMGSCVGAGLAVGRLPRCLSTKRLQYSGICFSAIALVCLFTLGNYTVPPKIGEQVIDALKGQALTSAIPGGLGVLLLSGLALWLFVKEGSLRSKAIILAIPVVSAIAFFATTLVQTGKPDLKVEANLGSERIAPINDAWDIYSAQHATLPPNLAALNRIHSLDGYDSLLHRDTVAMLRDIDGKDPAPPANGNIMYVKPSADLKKLADAGVTEVWSSKPLPLANNPVEDGGVFKYRIGGPGRASTPNGPAMITKENPSGLTILAKGPGNLTVRDRNMPGWLAKVDGHHAPVSGSTWLEIGLPEGEHVVELNYVAPGFMTALPASAIAWLTVILLAFWHGWRTRKRA